MATASSYNIRYGEVLSEIEITYAGFVNGENESVLIKKPVANYNATDMLHVGEYHITLSGGEAQNYTFSYQSGTLAVGKAPLTVTAASYTNRYGEGVTGNRVSYQGFVYDEDETVLTAPPTITCAGGDRPHVGTYALTPSGGEARDYEFVYEPGTLTVEKAPLTATPKPCTMAYGDNLPPLEIAYEGFVYDEDESVLTATPRATTDATSQSDTGTYPILLSGGEAQDYEFAYESGTLTIEQAEQEIWWPQDFSAGMLVGEEMELYATATCGEDVLFSSSDEQVILIDSQAGVVKLICLSEGEATITANQHGNKNYKPAPAVRKTIQVKEAGIGTGFSTTSAEGLTIYPNPATTHMNIQAEGGIKRVSLHSLAGTLLMDEDGHGEATHRLDLTRLPQGTYLLTVETPAGVCTERIVKE